MSKFGIWEGDTSGSSISLTSVFEGNTNITEITKFDVDGSKISSTDRMFLNCSNLKSVVLPSGLTSVGSRTFGICTSLNSITIPDSVTSIGSGAFWMCTSLSIYDFGNTKTTVPSLSDITVFNGTPNTKYIIVPDTLYDTWKATGYWSATTNNIVSSIYRYSEYYHMLTITRTDGTVEYYDDYTDGVITDVFSGQTDIQSVIIGKGATSMPEYMFKGCTGITSVVISKLSSITTIPKYAFESCFGQQSITCTIDAPNVTTLDEGVFEWCGGLDTVYMPSLTTVGFGSFFDCLKLSTLTTGSITSVGNKGFHQCTSLTDIDLSDTITIGEDAFSSCSSLTGVTMNKVTTIGDRAFNCGVTDITLPSTLTSMGEQVFGNSLTSITAYCPATVINANTFQGIATGGTLTYYNDNDLSSWLSTDEYYLGYYGWTGNHLTGYRYYMWQAYTFSNDLSCEYSEFMLGDGGGDYTLSAITAAPSGYSSSEKYTSLFDGKYTQSNFSKWCFRKTTPCYVIFDVGGIKAPTYFSLVTGNDTSNGRYAATWSLFGSNVNTIDYQDSNWVKIYDGTGGDEMKVNYTRFDYELPTISTEDESSDDITLVEYTGDGYDESEYTLYLNLGDTSGARIYYMGFNNTTNYEIGGIGSNDIEIDCDGYTGCSTVSWYIAELQDIETGEYDDEGNAITTQQMMVTSSGTYNKNYTWDDDSKSWVQDGDGDGDEPAEGASNQFVELTTDIANLEDNIQIGDDFYQKWTFKKVDESRPVTFEGTWYQESTE